MILLQVLNCIVCCADQVLPVVSPAALGAPSLNGGSISRGTGLYYSPPPTSQSQLSVVGTDVVTSLPSLPVVLSPPALFTTSDRIIGN